MRYLGVREVTVGDAVPAAAGGGGAELAAKAVRVRYDPAKLT